MLGPFVARNPSSIPPSRFAHDSHMLGLFMWILCSFLYKE